MIYNVLNLGAGWQSSRILLGACLGEIPKFDVAVFADTQWEPKAVYENLEFLAGEAEKAGIPMAVRTRGNLRADAIEFRRSRRSADGKRFASIPTFIRNRDGSQGRVRRQCTREYKIEVVERFIRREFLGLPPRGRIPKGVTVRQWFGISADEGSRAVFPGRMKERKVKAGIDLLGEEYFVKSRRWFPERRKVHVYALLNQEWRHDRTIHDAPILPRAESRSDCGLWLARNFPGRTFPRSACIGCPFRTNAEWRDMRDNRPNEWIDACDFDDAQRQADHDGQVRRGLFVGESFVHRQMVPLREADLDSHGENAGGGCGTLLDGMDGLCDV